MLYLRLDRDRFSLTNAPVTYVAVTYGDVTY